MVNIRTRAVTFLAPATAFVLIFLFGSSVYQHWVQHNANRTNDGNYFLQFLAYPHWSFSTNSSIRDLLSQDLLALLIIVFTWAFIMAIGSSSGSGGKNTLAHFLHGWATYIFAGAFAALIASFAHSGPLHPLMAATGGAAYGLLVGWIVGLVTLAAERGN